MDRWLITLQCGSQSCLRRVSTVNIAKMKMQSSLQIYHWEAPHGVTYNNIEEAIYKDRDLREIETQTLPQAT